MGSDVVQAVTGGGLQLEKGSVNGIPFLLCSRKDGKPKPLVVLSHAFRASKDMWRATQESTVRRGMLINSIREQC